MCWGGFIFGPDFGVLQLTEGAWRPSLDLPRESKIEHGGLSGAV